MPTRPFPSSFSTSCTPCTPGQPPSSRVGPTNAPKVSQPMKMPPLPLQLLLPLLLVLRRRKGLKRMGRGSLFVRYPSGRRVGVLCCRALLVCVVTPASRCATRPSPTCREPSWCMTCKSSAPLSGRTVSAGWVLWCDVHVV